MLVGRGRQATIPIANFFSIGAILRILLFNFAELACWLDKEHIFDGSGIRTLIQEVPGVCPIVKGPHSGGLKNSKVELKLK